ncbi:SsgA family sporulation/cell division regulator [Streptomyces sp. NPDC056525]|uniref:SsgA family sporulation/cell division regulator n=1 Tax=unclassified Streptomyces TaxID=2593676 RepID=UPI0036C5D5CD
MTICIQAAWSSRSRAPHSNPPILRGVRCPAYPALIALRLDTGESTVPLFARFAYSADLPYAVQADFLDGLAVLASWQFDRTMPVDGLRRPVGSSRRADAPRPCRTHAPARPEPGADRRRPAVSARPAPCRPGVPRGDRRVLREDRAL